MQTIHLHSSTIFFGEPEELVFDGSVLIITEKNVASLYLDLISQKIKAPQVFSLVLQGGEENKNFQTLEQILHFAFACKLDRKSTMIALGGGIISDLVGLASGLYMRGIDFYNIPTTLLAQVDASVGGKCGVNSPFGKNLIGLFHHPSQVLISPLFLKSLPPREFNAGMAEVIKMAVCFSPELFEKLFDVSYVQNHLLEIIFQSISIKANIVSQDERESHLRSALNYGHTFGHAIEKEQNFQNFLHGEAVSIGMVMANTLASKIAGFQESSQVLSLLKLHNLPTSYKIQNPDVFFQSLFLDKKTQNQQIKFILPLAIGSFDFFYPPVEEIKKILNEFAK
ncbi:3-dehydroquinate synthase [Helicobacter kayseriensis]|uniref:3-dehydroquinate synthase n=1 Tax=Helicobacter kayseriensis TaxID=2905877 RepID=UPI001E4C4CD2|nr:3-dehydroquinate synthase [Helicobacter kayseriensis]MCE3047449.1 3-dehydroquinate synthase [Helicobacter kayseriensis]MCE3048818.1 3-dehydroquinate synthase [Helicobacter kayseriensis]